MATELKAFLPNWNIGGEVSLGEVVLRILLSLVLSVVFAITYHLIQRKERVTLSNLPYTMILFSVIICGIMLAINRSLATAFGVLGAISILRFRINILNPTDMAAILFTMTIGISSSASPFWVTIVFSLIVIAVFLGLHLYYSHRYRLRRVVFLPPGDNTKTNQFLDEIERLFRTRHAITSTEAQGKGWLWKVELFFPDEGSIIQWEKWVRQDKRLLFTELKYQINLDISQWSSAAQNVSK